MPSYVLATIFVILMFMAIQVYGNWVAASVAEEKSSRVMELLISAATPRQLLFGKVLGNGAAGLTQYLVVLLAAGLGFLGLGVQPPTPSWGGMLNDGRAYITVAWWLTTFPGAAIMLTVLGINFVGDWLRDLLDPRLQSV